MEPPAHTPDMPAPPPGGPDAGASPDGPVAGASPGPDSAAAAAAATAPPPERSPSPGARDRLRRAVRAARLPRRQVPLAVLSVALAVVGVVGVLSVTEVVFEQGLGIGYIIHWEVVPLPVGLTAYLTFRVLRGKLFPVPAAPPA